MNGRRRPNLDEHLSLKEPKTGTRKKPKSGDRPHINVINAVGKPSPSRIGELKAVSAA